MTRVCQSPQGPVSSLTPAGFFTAVVMMPRDPDFAQAAMNDTQHGCVSWSSLALMFLIVGLVVAAVTAYGTLKCIVAFITAIHRPSNANIFDCLISLLGSPRKTAMNHGEVTPKLITRPKA